MAMVEALLSRALREGLPEPVVTTFRDALLIYGRVHEREPGDLNYIELAALMPEAAPESAPVEDVTRRPAWARLRG